MSSKLAETCEEDFLSADHDCETSDSAKRMVELSIQPKENDEENSEDGVDNDENEEDVSDEEFQAINAQLDQLNCTLDLLERKNDDIHAELIELLKSTKETRRQFQESVGKEPQNEESSS